MNKELKTKLYNVLKAEFDYVERNEKNKNKRIKTFWDIHHMQQIIENFDELEPALQEYFAKKANKEKFER